MLDVITIGEAMVVFDPGTKGPLKFVNTFEKKVGGAELNLAIGCARLGLNAGWISKLGNDEFGKYVKTFVRGEGINISEVELIDGYPTSLNFKEKMEDGSNRTFYYRDKSPTLAMKKEDLNEEYFKNAKVLHLSGVFPAIGDETLEVFLEAIKIAKRNNIKISFDPNIRLKLWSREKVKEVFLKVLPQVDILLAGDEEMEILIGEKDPEKIIDEMKKIGISYIAIKQGENGSTGYNGDEIIYSPPIKASKVVDTVGAGDGFDAGVLYGILNDWSLEKTLHFANTIGSMVVSILGDNKGLPYLEDIQIKLGEIDYIER